MEPLSPAPSLEPVDAVVRALVLYSLAEVQSGNANTIAVNATGRAFSIADNGRGHAIERNVSGSPYLNFIYTHFDYPFQIGRSAEIQLQGIGMSLLNALCSELSVKVTKRDVTLELAYKNGVLSHQELREAVATRTGTAVVGVVSPTIQRGSVDTAKLKHWLKELLTVTPNLALSFNGTALTEPPKSAA